MLEALNRLAKYCSDGGIEGQAKEEWLKVYDARAITEGTDQVFHVLSEAFKVLILHTDEMTPQELPRMFPSGTILREDAFT